ncbi:sugar phosphate isomerase/epimerase family protein [Sutcliffiella halmapala]|uniref:sugar phosphate isomerase/epimerase family protein n=1 Tax=Sutcliffiella halmapala TaxID=79882 RepID=UPI0009950621|nr:sugar phosphate isomerase/epimerase [Sutcliffiella halmapala]
MKHKIAAQLYTVRDLLEKDFPGVLKELKEMGYAGVQISGLFGNDPKEIAAVMTELGLGTAGMHIDLDSFRNELPRVLEEAEIFQTKDLILPYLVEEDRNAESYIALKAELNEIASKLQEDGYRISYHNHDFEFETEIDGQNALDYLLEPTEDNLLLAELDVYWVKKGDKEIISFLEPYANRMPIIHLKDMANNEEKSFAEVGTGSIDFSPILRWGEQNGIEWYAVEQDVCPGNPLDSLRVSITNLHKIIDNM